MKFIFISGIIFLLLSIGYLAYFFYNLAYHKISDNENKISNFIKNRLFTTLSCIIILGIFIYTFLLAESLSIKLLIFTVLLFIGFCLLFDGAKVIGIVWSIFIIWVISLILVNEPITIDETYTNTTIPLYNTSIIKDDLVIVELCITSNESNEKNYHTLMQYSVNDTKNLKIPNTIDCTKCKLIDSQDNRLEITRKEFIKCNILYYFGFTNFKPDTIIAENSTSYTVYINPDNIVYE